MPAKLENAAVATGLEKGSFHLIPKKGNAKECSNSCTTAPFSHLSKVMLKILQARLQQYVNHELPDVQLVLVKAEEQRSNCSIHWIIKKVRVPKKIYVCFIDYTKAFDYVAHNKLWKILKEMGIPDHLTGLLKICMHVKKQQLELDMEQ